MRQSVTNETALGQSSHSLALVRAFGSATWLLLICATLAVVGCVPKGGTGTSDGGGGWSIFDTEDRSLGDVRVWLRQYADQGVTGRAGTRATDLEMILINETHTQYEGVASDRLATAEWILPDVVARKLLSDLQEAGMLSPKAGSIPLNQRPDLYVRGLARKPYAWIAVEHRPPGQGVRYTFLPRHVPRNLAEDESTRDQQAIYLACLYKVLEAKGNAMYKDASRGTTARDLRPTRPNPIPAR